MSINANTTRLPKSDFSKAKFMHSYICVFSIYFFTKNYALPDSIAIAEILYIVERNKYPRFEKSCHLFKKGKEIREREKKKWREKEMYQSVRRGRVAWVRLKDRFANHPNPDDPTV